MPLRLTSYRTFGATACSVFSALKLQALEAEECDWAKRSSTTG